MDKSWIEKPISNAEYIKGASFRSRRSNMASTNDTSEPQVDFLEDNDDDLHVDDGGNRMPSWNGNISFKENEVVQTIDSNSIIGEQKGVVTPGHVCCLEGVKITVVFNDYYQPVGKGGHALVRFLGATAITGELCPIGKVSWHYVNDTYNVDIVKLARSKFQLPNHVILIMECVHTSVSCGEFIDLG